MKRTISTTIALCLIISLTLSSAYAASDRASSALQTVQVLGIINGDENGSLNLSANVTRAQFAKMMIAASSYRDTVSATASSSPFKDVSYTYWAASYIQQAVTAGWLTGYTDGTYKPDNSVKIEEAATAVLKMLGYPSSSFTGSYPEAQLAKYQALGLNDNILETQGSYLTRQDCVYLFYNLMGTLNTGGKYYAVTLGYTVTTSGEVDYTSLVSANLKGPFIAADSSWSASLPFALSSATVYRNGTLSSPSAISAYDVTYYNAGMRSIWVYGNRVTGTYTAASPSNSAPTSVTVAGNTYTIGTAAAACALSNAGSFKIGDIVTLLLGRSGDVAGVISPSQLGSGK